MDPFNNLGYQSLHEITDHKTCNSFSANDALTDDVDKVVAEKGKSTREKCESCINKIDLNLTFSQKCLLPIFTPYSIRYLKRKGSGNKIIGTTLLVPGISLVASLIMLVAEKCLGAQSKSKSKIRNQINRTADNNVAKRVVIVANKSVFMEHNTGDQHPEKPQRVEAIEQILRTNQLMNEKNTIKPRPANQDEISLCHDLSYQDELRRQIGNLQKEDCSSFDNSRWKIEHIHGDFIICHKTYNTSLYAAGAPLTAIDYILNEKNCTSKAFCIVRPPGHHAHQKTGSGFCVFNNVAIAAKYLTSQFDFKRVLIVDWDAHHGDGTQELIESDKKIFYFSTHRDTSYGFYPGRHWGHEKDNCSNILNCPVSGLPEESRQQILNAFKEKLKPAMDRYKPDFILISCGFDAHERDTLVGLGLKTEDYAELTRVCVDIANKYAKGRIVSVLEGGYNLQAISDAASTHVETLATFE